MLHLVIPELPASADASPHLPGLARLLEWTRGESAEADWRRGLARDLGVAPHIAPAGVVSAALPASAAGSSAWFAQPVHQVAGMSRVHLHPEGVLRLGQAEAQEFAAAFAGALGGEGFTLHPVGDGLLLVARDGAHGDDDADPVRWLGMELPPIRAHLPPAMRRLAAETEMWLHELPLNAARERRGALPVSALWMWGGADVHRASPGVAQAASWASAGTDPMLSGLARLGATGDPVAAAGFEQWAPASQAVAVLAPAWERGAPQWEALDERWFAPLAGALQRRAVGEVVLRFGGRRRELGGGSLRGWWRRARSRHRALRA